MSTELKELVEFLHSPQPPVRQIALENLTPFSQGQHTYIFKQDDLRPIKDLKNLIRDKTDRTVQLALTILVNLSGDKAVLDLLVSDLTLLEYISNSILDIKNTNADLYSILLANLAKNDQVTAIFGMKRTVKGKDEDSRFQSLNIMDCLMDCFVKGSTRQLNKYADFNYLAFFFADVSRFKQGREYFVNKQAYDNVFPISKLLVFTESESKIRRAGVASTIKNSLFDVLAQDTLVFDPSVNLLPYILLPLAGPGEIDDEDMFKLPDELQLLPENKKRDPDHRILATHVESLLLLCATRSLRDFLREKNVYCIIRELHKVIDDEVVQEPCERLVNIIMRDEEPESNIGEIQNEDDDAIVEVL